VPLEPRPQLLALWSPVLSMLDCHDDSPRNHIQDESLQFLEQASVSPWAFLKCQGRVDGTVEKVWPAGRPMHPAKKGGKRAHRGRFHCWLSRIVRSVTGCSSSCPSPWMTWCPRVTC